MARFNLNASGAGFAYETGGTGSDVSSNSSVNLASIGGGSERTYFFINQSEAAVKVTIGGTAAALSVLSFEINPFSDSSTRRPHPSNNSFVVDGHSVLEIQLENGGTGGHTYSISMETTHGTSVASGDDIIVVAESLARSSVIA